MGAMSDTAAEKAATAKDTGAEYAEKVRARACLVLHASVFLRCVFE
jgi:hypothetical protein